MGQPLDEKLWAKFNEHIVNEQLTAMRRQKLHAMYSLVSRNMPVSLANATRQDLEGFINRLHANKVYKATNGGTKTPISSSTKADAKKFLKQFYKWLRGNNEFYPPEVAWIKTRIAKDERPQEKEVLSIEEAQKLAGSFKNDQYKVLTLLLFDSGFRINEMLSVRKRDFTLEDFDEGQKCYWVDCKISKTVTRKVPVPLFTEELQHFIRSVYVQELNSNDLLFSVNYEAYLKQLKNVGQDLFKRKITPHALRHSSATYYAKAFEGNMNLIADRFGWTYSSKELATYIRKSGAYQKPQAKRVFSNDVMKLKEENQQLKEQMKEITAQLREQQEMIRLMYEMKKAETKKKYAALQK